MRSHCLTASCLSIYFALISPAFAQFKQPEQFYSNGERIGGWTRDEARRLKFTFWFVQYSQEDWPYRQQIVIIYDRNPAEALYFDVGMRRFEGRFDMRGRGYSLLPEYARRERLEDIREEDFPPPGEMPTIEEMLRRPSDQHPGSQSRMLPPPHTTEFPLRLGAAMQDVVYQENGVGQVAGVRVSRVEPGSVAARIGLEVGDIIVRVNDIRTEHHEDVYKLIAGSASSFTLRVKNVRDDLYIDTGKLSVHSGDVFEAAPAPPY